MAMKVTLIKFSRKKQVLHRVELSALAETIKKNPNAKAVYDLRLNYQFFKPVRLDDGQIVYDGEHVFGLPRIVFSAECDKYAGGIRFLKYNALVVIEVNGLKTYEDAVKVRNLASRMDETLMAYLGASGKMRCSTFWAIV